MKKTFLLALALIGLALPSQAQYSSSRGYKNSGRTRNYSELMDNSYFGFRLGFTSASVTDGSAKGGFNIGGVVGVGLSDHIPLYLESGVYYNEKGTKVSSGAAKVSYTMGYLEIPFEVKYKYTAAPHLTIEPHMGAFVALGVGGKMKDNITRETHSTFSARQFKRFDGGIRLGCDASYDMFTVGLSYDIGMANVGRDDFDSVHTGAFMFNIGVTF